MDVPALRDEPPPLVERLRGVHGQMVDAVIAGEGLARVAELASTERWRCVSIRCAMWPRRTVRSVLRAG